MARGSGMSEAEHNVKSAKGRPSKSWGRFLTGRPSPAFILWTRRILLGWWVALLLLEGPDFIRRFNHIRTTTAPGFDRSGALQHLVADACVELVALPGLLLAFGYGIGVDRTAVFTGGSWFRNWWPPTATKPKRGPDDS